MTNLRNIFGTLLIAALLFSCNSEAGKDGSAHAETPEALQDNKVNLSSYSRSGDLIEELYRELAEKNPELKKLEEDIAALNPKQNELTGKFGKYNGKSGNYYSSAEYKVSAISDSTLKRQILALIKNSRNKYENKTSELTSMLSRVAENSVTLSDRHAALKIVLTLPLIEKFQDDSRPVTKEFKELMKEQKEAIEHTDSFIIPES